MRVWIDLANSPHILFFEPLIGLLEKKGHRVFTTLRDFAQTVPLAQQQGIDGTVIGKHGGRSRTGKATNLIERSLRLAWFARKQGFDVALSHNSYTQIVAGQLTRKPTITLMDYEGQPANHLAFRSADLIMVPECFPEKALKRFGARPHRLHRYRGFKEQVYLSDFEPDPSFVSEIRETCGLPSEWSPNDTIIVTVRTPATMAAYHRFENPMFDHLLSDLDRRTDLLAIVLPRTDAQARHIRSTFGNLKIPNRPVDGRNLVSFSDLVISGGGTMNREAAILGTPAYTIFAGTLPAVDRRLIDMDRMVPISDDGDHRQIVFEKKKLGRVLRNPTLGEEIVDAAVDFAARHQRRYP